MKPFNLEQAKAGKPVVTRDGRPARILAFDRKGPNRIIGLVTHIDFEVAYYWFEDGRASADFDLNYDLVMKSEKKEGWINLFYGSLGVRRAVGAIHDNKDDALRSKEGNDYYITTIKVEWEE